VTLPISAYRMMYIMKQCIVSYSHETVRIDAVLVATIEGYITV